MSAPAQAHSHSHAEEFGAHGHKDHGHIIVPLATLRVILTLLLMFTLLTVGAALAEQWIASTFNVIIPQMVNVTVALSIAVVKTALVVLFFMQLKYDNPLNSMIFIFTILTVAFFLGFTAIDLGGRGTIDPLKSHYIIPGGTGINYGVGQGFTNTPITAAARLKAAAAGHHSHAHPLHPPGAGSITDAGFRPALPAVGSSSQRSRPVRGLTLPGFPPPPSATPAAEGGHGAPAAPDAGHGAPAAPPAAPAATPPAAPAAKPH